MYILTILSLIGVILNIHKKRASFLIWIASNTCWAAIDFRAGLPAQGWLFVIYACLAVWGFFAWKK